jgi:hypothetical protein
MTAVISLGANGKSLNKRWLLIILPISGATSPLIASVDHFTIIESTACGAEGCSTFLTLAALPAGYIQFAGLDWYIWESANTGLNKKHKTLISKAGQTESLFWREFGAAYKSFATIALISDSDI